jgi:hypothetical protein
MLVGIYESDLAALDQLDPSNSLYIGRVPLRVPPTLVGGFPRVRTSALTSLRSAACAGHRVLNNEQANVLKKPRSGLACGANHDLRKSATA